jgi:folate-binding Fe-S cluster repair protein YgfZ
LNNANELDYTLERYRLGIPEGPIEIRTNQALPMESNMELMNGG